MYWIVQEIFANITYSCGKYGSLNGMHIIFHFDVGIDISYIVLFDFLSHMFLAIHGRRNT